MKIINLGTKIEYPLAVALGFFDSIHIGHRKIIKSVTDYAKVNDLKSCVFTFTNNPYALLGQNKKLVYPFNIRMHILRRLNVEYVITAEFDDAFKTMSKENFLKLLNVNDVRFVSCGKDYRFGHFGEGNINYLQEVYTKQNTAVCVADDITIHKNRVSSTVIREQLSSGLVRSANRYLGAPYRVYGLKIDTVAKETQLFKTVTSDYVALPDGTYNAFFWLNSTKITTVAEVKKYDEVVKINISADISQFKDSELSVLFFTDKID